jgi:protein dithiol oxidoreductase (disulfide-forming)
MRLIQSFLLALALSALASTSALASADAPKAGAEYTSLETALPTRAENGKIEVIEFFSYACPHCRAFDPVLAAWVKKNADKISFRRVHVAMRAAELPLQRLYTTLEAMGLTEKIHPKVFAALHEEDVRLYSDAAVFEWVAKAGIDKAKFMATYNSFGMPSRLAAAQATVASFQVDHWPSIGIDGRFYTSPSKVATAAGVMLTTEQQQQGGLTVMDFLVAKAKAEKK